MLHPWRGKTEVSTWRHNSTSWSCRLVSMHVTINGLTTFIHNKERQTTEGKNQFLPATLRRSLDATSWWLQWCRRWCVWKLNYMEMSSSDVGAGKRAASALGWRFSKLFSRQSLIPNCIYLFTNLPIDTRAHAWTRWPSRRAGRFTIAIFEIFMS